MTGTTQTVQPNQVKTIHHLLASPFNVGSLNIMDYVFGFVEDEQQYAFAFIYGTQNSYFSNASKVESGKCQKVEISMEEHYDAMGYPRSEGVSIDNTDKFIVYLMEESELSLIIWDGGSPFEPDPERRIVINSTDKTVTMSYLGEYDVSQFEMDEEEEAVTVTE